MKRKQFCPMKRLAGQEREVKKEDYAGSLGMNMILAPDFEDGAKNALFGIDSGDAPVVQV